MVLGAPRALPAVSNPRDKRSRDSDATNNAPEKIAAAVPAAARLQHEHRAQATKKPSTVGRPSSINPSPSKTLVNSITGSKLKRSSSDTVTPFAIGEAVQCRDKGAQWKEGVVVSLEPLCVMPIGWDKAHHWDEVKAISDVKATSASRPKLSAEGARSENSVPLVTKAQFHMGSKTNLTKKTLIRKVKRSGATIFQTAIFADYFPRCCRYTGGS